jgi:outer membrane PBP1 activator LpoA protein
MQLGHCFRLVLLSLSMFAPALCAAQGKPASTPAAAVAPTAAPAAPAPAASAAPAAGEIALLLPLKSPDFQAAAEALRLGFMTARDRDGGKISVTIRATDASGEQILLEYEAAIRAGAKVIVGPLTRSGVAAVAASNRVSVPTLALNYPDAQTKMPEKLYGFGLSIEFEARQVARQARLEGMKEMLAITAASPLARRANQAFGDAFRALGGRIVNTLEFTPASDLALLKQMIAKTEVDGLFLAADVEQAREVRPFMSGALPTYATSLAYSGRNDPLANVDLNGIRFVEMPWLVQPDHTAVMGYPRFDSLAPELQRFYALGIDAYRLASELAANRTRISLDGVTGKLTLNLPGNQVEREAVATQFRDGAAVSTEPSR